MIKLRYWKLAIEMWDGLIDGEMDECLTCTKCCGYALTDDEHE
jgi:hypothetical protein